MNWNDVLLEVATRQDSVTDLSTGDPIMLPAIGRLLTEHLRFLATDLNCARWLTTYEDLDGVPSLIQAFVERCSRNWGRKIDPRTVFVTPGAQAALGYLFELLLEKDARASYPVRYEFPGTFDLSRSKAPSIGHYESQIVSGDFCRPTLISRPLDWKNVAAVVISQPHNPTGALWTRQELSTLATSATRNGAYLVLDQTSSLPFAPITVEAPPTADCANMFHVFSFSKVGLAGERVGLVITPSSFSSRFRTVLRRNVIQSPKLGQYLALYLTELFGAKPGLATLLRNEYKSRWSYLVHRLEASGLLGDPLRVATWGGGPFLWAEWKPPPYSESVFHRLLVGGVAVAPSCAMNPTGRDKGIAGIRVGLGQQSRIFRKGVEVLCRELTSLLR